MNPSPSTVPQTQWLRTIRRVVYWILPFAIFFLIIRRIDWAIFLQTVQQTSPLFLVLGLAYYPFVVLVAALRWRLAVRYYLGQTPPLRFAVYHYWVGYSLGLFAPASVGLDVYRVVAAGKRFGKYGLNAMAILVEKLMAFTNVAFMVIVLYPLLRPRVVHNADLVDGLARISIVILTSAGIGIALLALLFRHRAGALLSQKFHAVLSSIIARASTGIRSELEETTAAFDLHDFFRPIISVRPCANLFFASLLIQLASAVGNAIFFQAVGCPLPFLVNLFLLPIFYLVFLLPISFGSLGIREGAYITLYGLFGVAPEVALLVSFMNLMGLLLNIGIGATLLWLTPYLCPPAVAAARDDEIQE